MEQILYSFYIWGKDYSKVGIIYILEVNGYMTNTTIITHL